MSNERLVVKDPVCGMGVDAATAALSIDHGGQTFYFCSQNCGDAFAADPGRYVSAPGINDLSNDSGSYR